MTNQSSDNKLKVAYEMAMNAYQFSVQRHKEWMYIYAIICGALLVALFNDNICYISFAPMLIAILGCITTICWLLSFIGHYEWSKNFIRILARNEKLYFNEKQENELFVYNGVLVAKDYKDSDHYLPGFYSTQKITILFLKMVLIAWNIILAWTSCQLFDSFGQVHYKTFFFISLSGILFVLCLLAFKFGREILRNKYLCSDIIKIRHLI